MATAQDNEIDTLFRESNIVYESKYESFNIIETYYKSVGETKVALEKKEDELAGYKYKLDNSSIRKLNRNEINGLVLIIEGEINELKEELEENEPKARRKVESRARKSLNTLCLELEPDALKLLTNANEIKKKLNKGILPKKYDINVVIKTLKKYVSLYDKITNLLKWNINKSNSTIQRANSTATVLQNGMNTRSIAPNATMKAKPNTQPVKSNNRKSFGNRMRSLWSRSKTNTNASTNTVKNNKPKSFFNRLFSRTKNNRK
jgi:hypothetical protein